MTRAGENQDTCARLRRTTRMSTQNYAEISAEIEYKTYAENENLSSLQRSAIIPYFTLISLIAAL